VVRLPEGKDPDEVIRDAPDLWRESVRTAAPIVEYLVDFHARGADLRTTGGRARFVDAIVPTLRTVRNPVLRDGYLQRLRQVSGVEERVLLEALHRAPVRAAGPETRITADAVLASPDAFDPKAVLRAITPVERDLLRFLLFVPDTQVSTAERLPVNDLPSTPARELWAAILATREADRAAGGPGRFALSALFERLDEESRALAVALLERREGEPSEVGLAEQGIEQCLLRLELDRVEDAERWTRAELGEAERAGDGAAIERLMHQEQQHNEARLSLHRRIEQTSLLARPTGGRR
jgi:DNA primase